MEMKKQIRTGDKDVFEVVHRLSCKALCCKSFLRGGFRSELVLSALSLTTYSVQEVVSMFKSAGKFDRVKYLDLRGSVFGCESATNTCIEMVFAGLKSPFKTGDLVLM